MAAVSEHVVVNVQARFITKLDKYVVPDYPVSLSSSVRSEQLSALITKLLSSSGLVKDEDDGTILQFDFLINGELLRQSLYKHMQDHQISTENVVDIEYIERYKAPIPDKLLQHDDWISSVQAAQKFVLAGCYDKQVHLWDVTSGQQLASCQGHSEPVKDVAWVDSECDEPLFISSSQDQTILLWRWNPDTETVEALHSYRGHTQSVECVAVDETKTRFCSGSWDAMLKIWSAVPDPNAVDETERIKRVKTEFKPPPTKTPLMTLAGHTDVITTAVWSENCEICTAGYDHHIRIWDLDKCQEKTTLPGPPKAFLSISYSPRTKLLCTGSTDKYVRIWDNRSKEGTVVKNNLSSHSGWVSSVMWSTNSDNILLSGSYDMLLKVWDVRSPSAALYDMTGNTAKILSVDWSNPEIMVSGGADQKLRIFRSQ